jgi:hypothetical protein
MNGRVKDLGGSSCDLMRQYPQISLETLRKSMESLLSSWDVCKEPPKVQCSCDNRCVLAGWEIAVLVCFTILLNIGLERQKKTMKI